MKSTVSKKKSPSSNWRIVRELRKLQRGGVIFPEDVVKAAQSVSSPLHRYFTWDDTEAAHQHRLWEARMLIRTRVTVYAETGIEERVFVSLIEDREKSGYRELDTVLRDEDMSAQLLEDALAEMLVFKAKYGRLKKLADVFTQMDHVISENRKR